MQWGDLALLLRGLAFILYLAIINRSVAQAFPE